MRQATMSILGLYNYDNHLFDEMVVPAGVVKDNLINNILMEAAQLETYIPRFEMLKALIGTWSATRLDAWTKVYNALSTDYNPIENYDRNEEWTDTSNNTATSSGSVLNKVNGYNAPTLTDSAKAETTDSTNGSGTNTHTGHVHGNIGVTTNQQMIEAELDLRKTDIYEIITREFIEKFCILVY